MNCHEILDKFYEYAGDESMPLALQICVAAHLFFCPQCAQEIERFEVARDIMKTGFFPSSPDLEEPVMNRILMEESLAKMEIRDLFFENPVHGTGVSFKSWVITGLGVFFSLATAFFGIDFIRIAQVEGSSFLLPMGMTIGVILTIYGAIFVGSHIKELSDRFGLHWH
jgi:hypothetical protein